MSKLRNTLGIFILIVTGVVQQSHAATWLAQISSRPQSIRLMSQKTSKVEVRLQTEDGAPITCNGLDVLTKAGKVSEIRQVGPGRYEATYTAPKEKFPQLDMLVLRHHGEAIAWTQLELIGAGQVEVTTDPGANVKLEVAGKTFGPAQADAKGKAILSFEAPPGVKHGILLTGRGKRTSSQREIQLGVPLVNPIIVVPSQISIMAGDKNPTRIDTFCLGQDNLPWLGPAPTIKVSAGRAPPMEKKAPGWFVTEFEPPAKLGDGKVEFRVLLALAERTFAALLEFQLRPGPPAKIRATPSAIKLSAADGPVLVQLQVLDSNMNRTADTSLTARARCATAGPVKSYGEGRFSLNVIPSKNTCKDAVLELQVPRPDGSPLLQRIPIEIIRPPKVISKKKTVPPKKITASPQASPPNSYRTWAWSAMGLGMASLIPGVIMLAMDGKETCSSPDPVRCPEIYDTSTPGIVFTSLGSSLLVGSVVLHILAWMDDEDSSNRLSVSALPLKGGVLLGTGFTF